jgi:hypothetical protein
LIQRISINKMKKLKFVLQKKINIKDAKFYV